MGVRKKRGSDDTIINQVSDILDLAEVRKCYDGKALNLYRLAEQMNLKIIERKLSNDISGTLTKSEEQWIITVNAMHHKKRQRYTIAHEIAHYCLHRKSNQSFEDKAFFRNDTADNLEFAANNFAAELLMPKEKFEEAIKNGINTLKSLSDEFDVSTLAIKYRAKNLGYHFQEI